jgi:transcriptional regulator with XRE-family HTH domain
MTWSEIRAHLAALHAAAGTTQKAIADRGGIAGQNTVSRLLSNDKLGPSVEIFVRAIEGLGKPVSEFFIELEQGRGGTVNPPAALETAVMDRLQRIERALETLGVSLSSPGVASSGPDAQAPPSYREGEPPYDDSALSGVVDHTHIAARLERQQIAAIMQAARDSLLFTLARRDARVARLGDCDGTVPAKHPAGRSEPRRRRAARHAEPTTATTQTKGKGTR